MGNTLCELTSFGYKYGLPEDAHWVVDARFLANPFWDDALRPLTGLDAAVRTFVVEQQAAREFIDRLYEMASWVAQQESERSGLRLAIGCTGGRHRSVVVATELAQRLAQGGVEVTLTHRDIDKDSA